jgi:hypothetical protein
LWLPWFAVQPLSFVALGSSAQPVDFEDLTITAADYEFQTQGFALRTEGLLLDIHLILLAKPEDDIRLALDMLSGLIASRDLNNLTAIHAHFSEAYLAANDRVTQFGLATGVIPANFDGIIPAITNLTLSHCLQGYFMLEYLHQGMFWYVICGFSFR